MKYPNTWLLYWNRWQTNPDRHKLQCTENFIDAIKTVQTPGDYRLVSFDVKSLFTSIPLQLALDCTATAIKNSTTKLPLPTADDLMDLLKLFLTSTYIQYNGKHYKQLHGTAMGSPVFVVVEQNIEERALATYKRTLLLWLRYVDDIFTARSTQSAHFRYTYMLPWSWLCNYLFGRHLAWALMVSFLLAPLGIIPFIAF